MDREMNQFLFNTKKTPPNNPQHDSMDREMNHNITSKLLKLINLIQSPMGKC
jgi:hypothetical protein